MSAAPPEPDSNVPRPVAEVIGISDTVLQWHDGDGELVSLDVGHGLAHTEWGIRHFEHATGVTTTVELRQNEDDARRRLSILRTLYVERRHDRTVELVRREIIYGPWQNENDHAAQYCDQDDRDDDAAVAGEVQA